MISNAKEVIFNIIFYLLQRMIRNMIHVNKDERGKAEKYLTMYKGE